ncbi:MAG: hypothetical protein H6999_11200 [Hahellaceae bacterium]|nr:hypothetical protein [Hahellaceae bacterium]
MKNFQLYARHRNTLSLMWALTKLAVAFLIIKYVDFGIYIVIGYMLFSLESISSLQYLNAHESNLQFSRLQNNVATNMAAEIAELKNQVAELELRIVEAEIKIEDIT